MSAGNGRAVWLVDGADPILVTEGIKALVDDLAGDTDHALVVEDFRGDDVDLATVADACRTPPFLADRRIVVLRDVGRWLTADIGPLLAYLEDPLDTTALVLGVGGGTTSAKLVTAVKARGHVTGTAVAGKDAKGWLRDRLRAAPVRLDAPAEARLEVHLGEDVSRLGAILDILVSIHGEGAHLGAEDIEPYLGEAGSVAPWDLTDAIDDGETEVALLLAHRLLGAGERHPLVILSILHRHISNLLRVDGPGITTEAAAATALGIAKGRSTFPARKALDSARRYGSAGIAEAIGLLASAELDVKGKIEWPGDLVVDVLVARLCRLARAGGGRRTARRGSGGERGGGGRRVSGGGR